MEEKESGTIVKKVYQEVKIEAKNSPKGSYAAGCPSNYGYPNVENC